MRALLLLLLLLAYPVAAATWKVRSATVADVASLVAVHNNVTAAETAPLSDAVWTEADATPYATNETSVVLRNGVIVGFWYNLDYSTPNEAIIAGIDYPYILTTLTLAQRTDALGRLARAVVTHQQGTIPQPGRSVVPTAIHFYIPTTSGIVAVVNTLACASASSATEDGLPVFEEMICDLAALDAALTARGF